MATGGSASAAAVRREVQMEQETHRHESQLANEYPALNPAYAKETIGGHACNLQFCSAGEIAYCKPDPSLQTGCGDLTRFKCLVLEHGFVKENRAVRFGSWS